MEIWKSIEGYEGKYEVSSLGRVKSLSRVVVKRGIEYTYQDKIIYLDKTNTGYFRATLCKDGSCKKFGVHRLVAQAFISNPEDKPTVNHIDGDKSNNTLSNLEWNTHSENSQHSIDTGLQPVLHGWLKRGAKLTKEQVEEIRGSYVKGSITHKEIAKKYNVSRPLISRLLGYVNYKNKG
jgi:NUMOD4 motif/HNH endonuclease